MASCFLCGTDMVPRFKARDHLRPSVTIEYPVEWCSSCEFGSVAKKVTPREVASFYTQGYYTHVTAGTVVDEHMAPADRLRVHLAWRTDRGIDLSPSEVKPVSATPTLCDVGCGSGQAMAAFKDAGYEAVGIEPDGSARALAQKLGTAYEGTAEALPNAIEGKQFDVVLLSHVLEHCISPGLALTNVKRLLAPGGTAIIEVPNNAATGFEVFGPGWFFADVPRHLQFFTETSLRKALDKAGLSVTRVIYTGYARQFSPGWAAAQKEIRQRIGLENKSDDSSKTWGLLAKTAFADPSKKYDSIRVHAVHQD